MGLQGSIFCDPNPLTCNYKKKIKLNMYVTLLLTWIQFVLLIVSKNAAVINHVLVISISGNRNQVSKQFYFFM